MSTFSASLYTRPPSWSRTSHGVVCFRILDGDSTKSFPAEDWDDFVTALLAQWARVLSGESTRLPFMEGGFYVDVSVRDGEASLSFADESTGGILRCSARYQDLIAGLLVEAEQLERTYERQGWPVDRDLRELLALTTALRARQRMSLD